MGRRRHQLYLHSPISKKIAPEPLSRVGSAQTRARASSTVGITHHIHSHIELPNFSYRLRTEKKAQKLRVFLQRVVSISAVGVCAEAVMGYFVVLEDQEPGLIVERDCLKAGVCLLSLIQVALAVCYWNAYAGYLESVQSALCPGSVLTNGLRHSPTLLCYCGMDVTLSLITLYPGFFQANILAMQTSSDSLAYVFILFRTYQAGRLLYWLCPFSNMRTHIFTRVTTVEHNNGFVMRCCVARYGFFLLALVCGLIVLILGILEFIFERRSAKMDMDVIWNDFWVVAYTLPTIGYGNVHPTTFCGQVFIVICALFCTQILGFLTTVSKNSLNLSLRECDLYSDLLYTRYKEKSPEEAVFLLQTWWRLMKMRLMKTLHAPTILRFYSQLREYRTTLVACQQVKDTLFERQIEAFDLSTHTLFRNLTEYLQPINSVYPLLQDHFRNEYRIKSLCKSIHKLARKNTLLLHHIHPSIPRYYSENPDPSHFPGHKLHHAKAKLHAYQNAVGRLIKDEAWVGPAHIISSRYAGKSEPISAC